jgi:hypothetical protein
MIRGVEDSQFSVAEHGHHDAVGIRVIVVGGFL